VRQFLKGDYPAEPRYHADGDELAQKAAQRGPHQRLGLESRMTFRWILQSRSIDHDLFGKPAPNFPDHALVGIQGRPQDLIR
jgi:hypothetical protein